MRRINMEKIEKIVYISPPMSLEGWKFLEWLKGNWKTIKELLKVGAPLVLSLAFVKDNPVLIATLTAFGKLILDSLEFYFTKVEIKSEE